MKNILIVFWLFFVCSVFAQNYKVLQSDEKSITIEIDFNKLYTIKDTIVNNIKFTRIIGTGQFSRFEKEPLMPEMFLSFGIPFASSPKTEILEIKSEVLKDKFLLPVPTYNDNGEIVNIADFNKEIYSTNNYIPSQDVKITADYVARFSRIMNIQVAPIKFNPIKRELVVNKKIKFRVFYNENEYGKFEYLFDKKADEFIRTSVVNYSIAKNWIGRIINENANLEQSYWYNPNKEYFKIYLKEKGIYRIKYSDLVAAGLDNSKIIKTKKLELFCNGVRIPIDVFSKGDSIFNRNSYLQFLGTPPAPSPYSKLNIYNNSNVYWLSYEADTVGYHYKDIDGKPLVFGKTIITNKRTLHYERDTIYEHFGHAENENRDFWQWGKAAGNGGEIQDAFFYTFPSPQYLNPDSVNMTLRVSLHGVTVGQHQADIELTGQPVGNKVWSGQRESIFERTFKLGDIKIFPSNSFQVFAKGQFEQDIIRINWFEIDYWQNNSAYSDKFDFISPNNLFGKTRFVVYEWTADTMLVYIPSRGEIIRNANVTHNQWKNVEFVDQLFIPTEYWCVSLDNFLQPDSIVKNINSNLRNTDNGADYLIITHPKFLSVANRLANFRRTKLTGYDNPRVAVINVLDIYNEFNGGLLNPYAIRDFIKYTYTKWKTPAPAYVALMGDMSHDYRKIFPNSRENYIPSIPYQSYTYGQAASDNMFVAVDGIDLMPDMAIGRISCETVEEANILVDKIISYPNDNSKEWRQRINLFSAGQSAGDENNFKFNDENTMLFNTFISPQGYSSYRVYTFPNTPEYKQYAGGTLEMKNGFNNGAVITNFFGHGGGYQWDLFFLNDHIYQLTNDGRLPFITSITCYTAHYDNQDVFGEQFIKVPGKGAIGFWGHTGLTIWPQGKALNAKLYNEIFNKKYFVIGDAIRNAKNNFANGMLSLDADHVSLLTLLGDPAIDLAFVRNPDFKITSENISFSPESPLIDENVSIKVKVNNLGTIFPNDSVSVKLSITSADTSYNIPEKYMQSFGELDSIVFVWKPTKAGLFSVKVKINSINEISEEDYSDNEASKSIPVYNVKETNIISPENGASFNNKRPKFVIADPGFYINKNYTYFIEIDTSLTFGSPLIKSPELIGKFGMVEWSPGQDLASGVYYWRSRVKDVEQAPYWSNLSTFKISTGIDTLKFSLSEKQLLLFSNNNMNYDYSTKSLVLNLSKLPPKPSQSKFIEDIFPDNIDGLHSYSSIATDGTYLYIGHMAFFAGATHIYKFGTGLNGTEKGKYYGIVSPNTVKLWNTMFEYNGSLYTSEGDPYKLVKINLNTGVVDTVTVEDGLLDVYSCKVKEGAFYLKNFGNYVFNLTVADSTGEKRYTLRKFDATNNFAKVGNDMVFTGTSFDGFTDFFVFEKYLFVYENFQSGFMRRMNMETGEFEDADWLTNVPYQGYYSWIYDKINDIVYSSVYKVGKLPKISKFAGTYYQTFGSATSPEISNVKKWKQAEYEIISEGSNGEYHVNLEGFKADENIWVSVADSVSTKINIDTLDVNIYKSLRYKFFLSDTSRSITNPLQIKSVKFDYEGLPEIQVSNASISFNPDSLMQGFSTELIFEAKNFGLSQADSVKFDFRLNENGNPFYSTKVKIPADSTALLKYSINTTPLLFNNKVKVECNLLGKEKFTFNNVGSNSFFVSRDSLNPSFDIKFDGEDIINGDIISAKPNIEITLKDNSPLPLDSTFFYVYHNNVQVHKDSLRFSYTPYPNSTAYLSWNPTLKNGTHYLEVLARDASLNYFDTTSYKIWFVVSNKNELREIYNYPNPFAEGTYFTFNMTGTQKPEEIKIKIYTITGRLIKNLEIPTEPLKFGFNKFYWNGKDEDGDEIGNGVYFYKIIITEDGVTKSETKKIVKLK
ncbi:MAG TPA: C25 family cysteine peptidase [Melioribacteraceae bacterium]|nr:C25 family cysteine peptidase [Melioribacteraceae bacterium]